jgi:tartrate dehydrogenase/decarboxylase/D-malate dehydrogenase
MPTFTIAVIPGVGVGIEVVAEGRRVLEAVARRERNLRLRFTTFGWGSAYYRKHGRMMPADGLDILRRERTPGSVADTEGMTCALLR